MREILFRGKTISGNWVQGLLANKNDEWYISNKAGFPFAYEIYPETICQYTGLTDRNGKKIWEGDIVREIYYPHHPYEVIWSDEEGGWALGVDAEPLYCIGSANGEKNEVIGNVFENQELLEV